MSELRVTTDRPYRILFIADFAGSDAGIVSGEMADGVIDVKPSSFDALIAEAKPTIEFTLADPTSANKRMVTVNLAIDSMKAFDPKNLVKQLPCSALVAIRQQLVDRLHNKITQQALADAAEKAAIADEENKWLNSMLSAAPAEGASDSDVDDLMGMLDLGDGDAGGDAPPAKSGVGGVLADAAASGGIDAGESSNVRKALGEVDRRLNAWLNAVLHSPQVQPCESAWRALSYLLGHLEFRKGIRLSVLHAHHGALAERVRERLIDPVFDSGADAPDLIVVDKDFDKTAPDMELMDELSQHAASLPAVLFVSLSAKFLGVSYAWQVPTLPPLINTFDQWQYAKWKSLRSQHYARSLAVFFGRCLLRAAHTRGEASGSEFAFVEAATGEKDLLWAAGPVAAAVVVARGVVETGWPTRVAGYAHGRVPDFATTFGGPKGDKQFGPADTVLKQEKIDELGAVGVNVVAGSKDHPDAMVSNGLTAARPAKLDPNAFLEVSQAYQLFAGRLSNLLLELKPHLSGLADDKVKPEVERHLTDWLTLDGQPPTPEQINIEAQGLEGEAGSFGIAISVSPPSAILPATERIRVDLGLRLR